MSDSNDSEFKKALNTAFDLKVDSWQAESDKIKCDAYTQFMTAKELYRSLKGYPMDWNINQVISRSVWKPEVQSDKLVKTIQDLFDKTHVRRYTRDRKGQPVPSGLQVLYKLVFDQNIMYLQSVYGK